MARIVTRLHLQNYKSIEECDLRFAELSILLGRNGAGKSNVVDALDFISSALYVSLENAIRDRGGVEGIQTRLSAGRPRDIEIGLYFGLGTRRRGEYVVRIAPDKSRGYVVKSEMCRVYRRFGSKLEDHFHVERGKVVSSSVGGPSSILHDRLYLVVASSLTPFRRVYNTLSRMNAYNLDVAEMRTPQLHDVGNALYSDGSNLASVVSQMQRTFPERWSTVQTYLTAIVPEIIAIRPMFIGPRVDLQFEQRIPGGATIFPSLNMSDGTLRALGVLVALFQESTEPADAVNVVALEEPEMALHPGGTQTLFDAISEACDDKQVLITSHSPDLLDRKGLDIESLLAVSMRDGRTFIASMDDVTRSAVHDHLYTPGQLLRMGQLK